MDLRLPSSGVIGFHCFQLADEGLDRFQERLKERVATLLNHDFRKQLEPDSECSRFVFVQDVLERTASTIFRRSS